MKVLAFDFGGSTGRALLGEIVDGKLNYREVNRFDNIPHTVDGHMHWDFETLWTNIKESIRRAGDIDSIGIDTWGVDYGMIDYGGKLVCDPYHYRDSRVDEVYDEIMSRLGDSLYERTGIEIMKINTMFQLVSEMRDRGFDGVHKILFMPDLFAYMLTGKMRSEYTIATTSGLIDPSTRDWNMSLIDELGLPRDIFAPIIMNGDIYGYVREDLARELGLTHPVEVVAVCTHDTASAITAMVASPEDSIYISSGTWSLIGIEREDVDVSNALFTNEGGYHGSVTYLSNIMGLWLMQEMRRKMQSETPDKKVGFGDMEKLMSGLEEGKYIVDTNDDRFVAPSDMEDAIKSYVREKYHVADITRGEVIRCIYDSLADTYRARVEDINRTFGGKYRCINILGGGSQARPLAERTAKVTGLKVVTGPIEATAIGNMLVQLIHLGTIKNIKEAREIVSISENVGVY